VCVIGIMAARFSAVGKKSGAKKNRAVTEDRAVLLYLVYLCWGSGIGIKRACECIITHRRA